MKTSHLLNEECKKEIQERLRKYADYVNETASGSSFNKAFIRERIQELEWILGYKGAK